MVTGFLGQYLVGWQENQINKNKTKKNTGIQTLIPYESNPSDEIERSSESVTGSPCHHMPIFVGMSIQVTVL